MSFEIQELPDIIKLVILLSFNREESLTRSQLKNKLEHYLERRGSIDLADLEEALEELISEGLIVKLNGKYGLTKEGVKLSSKWRSLLTSRSPILEFIAGLTDGAVTGLVIVFSAFLAHLALKTVIYSSILTLTAVSITNFSSFLLGGKTEDIANALSFKTLVEFSLRDISDKAERRKSFKLVKRLFSILKKEISKTNFLSAATGAITTFASGIVPVAAFIFLKTPLNIFFSLIALSVIVVFLIYYRVKKSKEKWKTTVSETLLILTLASIASLMISSL